MFEDDETGASNLLEHNYTLFYHSPQDPDWSINSYKEVSTFSTVEKMTVLLNALNPTII